MRHSDVMISAKLKAKKKRKTEAEEKIYGFQDSYTYPRSEAFYNSQKIRPNEYIYLKKKRNKTPSFLCKETNIKLQIFISPGYM